MMWYWKMGKICSKVGKLNCIDPQKQLMLLKKLKKFKNIKYYQRSLDRSGLKNNSQDFDTY